MTTAYPSLPLRGTASSLPAPGRTRWSLGPPVARLDHAHRLGPVVPFGRIVRAAVLPDIAPPSSQERQRRRSGGGCLRASRAPSGSAASPRRLPPRSARFEVIGPAAASRHERESLRISPGPSRGTSSGRASSSVSPVRGYRSRCRIEARARVAPDLARTVARDELRQGFIRMPRSPPASRSGARRAGARRSATRPRRRCRCAPSGTRRRRPGPPFGAWPRRRRRRS